MSLRTDRSSRARLEAIVRQFKALRRCSMAGEPIPADGLLQLARAGEALAARIGLTTAELNDLVRAVDRRSTH